MSFSGPFTFFKTFDQTIEVIITNLFLNMVNFAFYHENVTIVSIITLVIEYKMQENTYNPQPMENNEFRRRNDFR